MAGTSRRVVVTGMGALTPLGLSVEEYWRGLVEGESGAATIESFDPEGLRVTFACELDGFDPEDHLPAKQARRVDPFSQYALVTADQAVADAGLDPDGMSQDEKDRIGVVYGTGIGGIKTSHRDGFVMGEGAGALFIEDLERARARGATIYAEIEGIGMSADAHHLTAPDPEGGGVCLALNRVLDNAGLEPTDVDYINAHGTSTPLGDEAETKALKKVFDDHAYDLNVSSTKSMTGHLLGAAGAIEAIAAIQALRHDVVPPTINFEEADPACDLDYTFNEAEERPVSVALSNAFGFGGHNTSLALRAYDE